ncbi:hypothetical protein B0H13DRAFT_1917816 [Mycena leptocephala]|nr:hypothetical protein B0H13DRAFT_1917816 [Mycena leptocephala]
MVAFLPVISVLLLIVIRAASQVASPSWRQPNITTLRAERVRLAGAALDTALDRLGADGLFPADPFAITGNLYSQLALFDLATNQTKYERALDQYFQIVLSNAANFSNTLTFGHAAAKAYAAYKKKSFLEYAVQSWWRGRKFTLSVQDIAAGKVAEKSFTLTKVVSESLTVHTHGWRYMGYATGYFLGLSALLAEITLDPSYLVAATESADFIRSQLYNVRNIVQPDISASASDSPCEVFSDTTPFESGLMIEGLAVLTSLTNNVSMQSLLDDLLTAAIPNTAWQDENGIVTVHGSLSSGATFYLPHTQETSGKTGDTNLLQGLGAVYQRNVTSAAMHEYIGDYIAVQFNAVTELATFDGSNIYAGSWTGPPSSSFSGINQTMALAALINAIGVDDDELSTSTAAPAASSPPPASSGIPSSVAPQKKSSHLAAIIGGALGGVAVISLILATLWCLRARDSRTPKIPTGAQFPSPGLPSIKLGAGGKHVEQHSPGGRYHSPVVEPATRPANLSSNSSEPAVEQAQVNLLRASAIPTEQLVTVLNQRLQNRHWDDREAPPEYPVTDGSA